MKYGVVATFEVEAETAEDAVVCVEAMCANACSSGGDADLVCVDVEETRRRGSGRAVRGGGG